MSRGEVLQRAWHDLTDAQRRHLMRTLASYVHQLRTVPQSAVAGLLCSGWIGSATRGPFWDFFAECVGGPLGPFPAQGSFNDWRVSLFDKFGQRHAPAAAYLAQIRREMPDAHPLVFTHADIAMRNVLVRVHGPCAGDVEEAGSIDLGQAGWHPIYWEGLKFAWAKNSKHIWQASGRQVLCTGYDAEFQREFDLQLVAGGIPP
ncbi:hypothetical protein FISHEDRAFT_68779 [Fistulina hepatica ATCC 64428]|uniref:Aminoglycoside phosphotransferase domain-containing protein n=1 Tax=Fistulina hepatica ATCC 64428 TaxID=1128425 RepID=A0A0D7AP71_9AGAR|nr:hypothetical protein FISHEDRAFT_68779 [Fistulina hepatica ATCC 64428]